MTSEFVKQHSDARKNLALWFCVLAGPIAWLLNFQINYALVQCACTAHQTIFLKAISLTLLLIVSFAGIYAWRLFNQAKKQNTRRPIEVIERSKFMSALGIMLCALFGLIIIAQAIATFFISPC